MARVLHHQCIAFSKEKSTLSPKTESGYLLPKCVFATKYIFLNKSSKSAKLNYSKIEAVLLSKRKPYVENYFVIKKRRTFMRKKDSSTFKKIFNFKVEFTS